MSPTPHKPIFWQAGLLLIFLITISLVNGIHATHMRPDENLVYDFTNRSLPGLVQFLAEQDVHPPLWFSSFWLWRQLAGDSEFVARVYTILLSMLTLALVYQVGRKWFGKSRYGLFAVTLLGANAFFYIHALEIRPYGLNMLLATTSMWTFQRWLTQHTWRSAVFYALTIPVLLYVHYFLFVLILVQVICWFIYWLILDRHRLQHLRQALGVTLLAGALWLPWFPAAAHQIVHLRASDTAGGNERGLFGSGATTIPTSISAVKELAAVATNGLVWLYVGILLIGLLYWWRRGNYWLVLAWALLVPALSMTLNQWLAVYLPRYVVYLVIGLALALGAALGRLPNVARWLALLGVTAASLLLLPDHLPNDRIPFRDLYRQISSAAQPDDVLFFDRGGLNDGFVRAQIRRYLDPELSSRRVSDLAAAQSAHRVWYVTDSEWWTDSTRMRFEQLEATHPLQRVIGDCNRDWCYLLQLMEARPTNEPQYFGDSLAFWGLDVDEVSPESIVTRLWWTVTAAIPLDYSIGLHLFDAQGVLVAQNDGALHDYYTGQLIQTSQMETGKIYIDDRRLQLPLELPAGDYQLAVLVYQSWDNTRLLLPNGQDQLTMETIVIP